MSAGGEAEGEVGFDISAPGGPPGDPGARGGVL